MTATISFLSETKDSTLSKFLIDGVPYCFILEDGFRLIKEYGQTRIEGGNWQFKPVFSGRFFDKYSRNFGHKFALGLEPIDFESKFDLLRMHGGNKVVDSLGCPLTGLSYIKPSSKTKNCFEVVSSIDAYKRVYEALSPEILVKGFVPLFIDRYGSEREGLIEFTN